MGSLAGLVVKVLAAISLFLMNIVVTRTLGATQSGLFFLGFTLVTIIATIGRFGLDQALVRFIAKDCADSRATHVRNIYNKAVVWSFTLTLCITALLYINAQRINDALFNLPGFGHAFQTILLATPFIALFIIHAHALQGLKKISQSMLIASVCLPSFILLMVAAKPPQYAYEVGFYVFFSSAVTALLARYLWLRAVPTNNNPSVFSSGVLRTACTSLWTIAVVHQIIQWSSQLLLGVWESAETVAFFATAQRTAMLTSFVLFAVNSIVAPKFAALHALNDIAGVKRIAIVSVRLMLAISIPVTGLIVFFPEFFMALFGEEFSAASTALVILAIGQFINIATGSVGYLLSMTGNEKKARDNIIVSGVVSAGLGALLIPFFGIIGAAFACAIGVSMQNLLGVYQVKKQLGFNTLVFWQSMET